MNRVQPLMTDPRNQQVGGPQDHQQATAQRTSHSLEIARITHHYGSVVAVRDISLHIAHGELMALLGPSGCGKTTLLRIIAGFLRPTEGEIFVDGHPITRMPPTRRGVGIVFQNFALFPHMNVWENVAYGLRARRIHRDRIRRVVDDMLDLVRLIDFAERFPRELSGGQQQRVALARALAVQPRILLLDEPFGALDKNLRLDMQIEIKKIQRDLAVTCILVTHDQEEALSMADRIAVLNEGSLEQCARPAEIYDRPASLFVNTFVGTTNLLPGKLTKATTDHHTVSLDCGAEVTRPGGCELSASTRVVVSVRPEQLRVSTQDNPASFHGRVEVSIPLGPTTVYEIRLDDQTTIKVTEPRVVDRPLIESGATVYVSFLPGATTSLFPRPLTGGGRHETEQ